MMRQRLPAKTTQQSGPQNRIVEPFSWADRIALINEAEKEKGNVLTPV
jgi:hypothetical protein